MPNTQQAAKRIRQTKVRTQRNRARKTQIKTYTKRVEAAIEAGDIAKAETEFHTFQQKVDKAAKARSIHPNKASRQKSRLAAKLNAAKGK